MSARQRTGQLERRPVADPREQMLAGLPVVERRMTVAGISTAVLEGGDGPPIILLHSAGEFAALWMRVIPDLTRTHRVIAPDLPGHGASAGVDRALGEDRLLAWLGELIDRTCPSSVVLVGHALGGAVAARFASHHGGRLRQLVLVDAVGLAPLEPELSFRLASTRFLETPNERTRDDLFRQCFVDLDGLREQMGEGWEPIAAYALDRMRTPDMRAALDSLIPQFSAEIPSADLAKVGVPTALIWGRHDLQVPVHIAEAASARYGWPLHVVDGAGDDPAVERPEAFVEALRTALESSTQMEATS